MPALKAEGLTSGTFEDSQSLKMNSTFAKLHLFNSHQLIHKQTAEDWDTVHKNKQTNK